MNKIQQLFIWVFCITCLNGNAFGQQVIQEIPPSGIVIFEPDTYVFGNNIVWSPTSDSAAITILVSDVTLDMQGFTLQSIPTSFKTIGILSEASNNLQISNGTIQNMGLSGILCNQGTTISINNVVVDGINVNDTVDIIQPGGISIASCSSVTINQCFIENINVQASSAGGIQFDATINSTVTNCQIKNLLNRDGICAGIAYVECQGITIKNCNIDTITTQFIDNLNTSGHTAIGILPFLSSNITIKNCTISNITGCCDDAHGMSLFICSNATVSNCEVNNVLDGAGSAQTGAKATGIEVYASEVIVKNCMVNNIVAINPQDLQAAGFSVALADNVQFINCVAGEVKVTDANGNYDPSLGYGVGYGWAPDPRPEFEGPAVGILYQNCVAANCQVGFDTWDHINSNWTNIVSECNGIPILIQPEGQRTLTCNPCSECGCVAPGCFPIPFSVTIDNEASNNTFTNVVEQGCQ